MSLRDNLTEEIKKMEEEIKKCYDIANKNFNAGQTEMWHRWNARAEAFRDCKNILSKILEDDIKNARTLNNYGRK